MAVTYTLAAVVGVVAVVVLDLLVLRTKLLLRKGFWAAYVIIVFFQLIINGILTGLPVVRYDDAQIIGARIAHAPVEDLLFGFALVLATLSLWTFLGSRPGQRPDANLDEPPGQNAPRAGR